MPATIIDRRQARCPADRATRPLLAPENDRICEKVVAPTMMNRIMPEIASRAAQRRAAGCCSVSAR